MIDKDTIFLKINCIDIAEDKFDNVASKIRKQLAKQTDREVIVLPYFVGRV